MRVLIRPDWAGDFTMKRIRHTPEQIIRKLKTAEQLIAQNKTHGRFKVSGLVVSWLTHGHRQQRRDVVHHRL
jgi:hypothetical protein